MRSLFSIGLHVQEALPTAAGCSEEHLQQAISELDRLIGDIRTAALAVGAPADAVCDRDASADRPAAQHALMCVPRNAPTELHRLLDTAGLLHARLHRVTVALTLCQEAAADLLERLADDESSREQPLRGYALRARTSAAECRDFARRLEDQI